VSDILDSLIADGSIKRPSPQIDSPSFTKRASEDALGTPILQGMQDNGRVYRTPSGLLFVSDSFSSIDQREIERLIQRHQSGMPRSALPEEMQALQSMQTTGGALGATLEKASQGLPFVGEFIPEVVGGVSPEARSRMETRQRVFEEEEPALALGARTIGATAPMAIPGAGAMLGSPVNPLAAGTRGAVLAGGEAGISGFGAGEGDIVDRGIRGAQDAALGATFGGLFSYLSSRLLTGSGGIGDLREAAKEIAKDLQISDGAALILAQTIRGGGSVEDGVARIRQAGDQGMLADADLSIASLLDTAIQMGGPEAQRVGTQTVARRSADQGRQIESALDETLGPPPAGVRTLQQEAYARTRDARQQAYSKAYDSPINYASPAGQRLEAIIERIPVETAEKAIRNANRDMALEGMPRQSQIKFTVRDDGSVALSEQPNVMQLDYIKRALQAEAFNNVGVVDKPLFASFAGELRDALADLVPAYKQALKLGGDTIKEAEAADVGKVIFRAATPLEDVLSAINSASQTELETLRLGARVAFRDAMENARGVISSNADDPQAIAAGRKIVNDLSSAMNLRKLGALLGEDTDEFRRLTQQLEQSRIAFNLDANIAQNSATARRMQLKENIDEATAPTPAQSILMGRPGDATQGAIQNITGVTEGAITEQRQRALGELARVLTGADGLTGKSAERAFALINKRIAGATLDATEKSELDMLIRAAGTPAVSELVTMIGNL